MKLHGKECALAGLLYLTGIFSSFLPLIQMAQMQVFLVFHGRKSLHKKNQYIITVKLKIEIEICIENIISQNKPFCPL